MSEGAPTGRVLVVDDDRVNRMLLTRSLAQAGHLVRTAANGREALEVLREDPPDVVLLDMLMPELDGMAVLEQMEDDDGLNHLPVIMISAVGFVGEFDVRGRQSAIRLWTLD